MTGRPSSEHGARAAGALAAAELRPGQLEVVAEDGEQAPGRLDLERRARSPLTSSETGTLQGLQAPQPALVKRARLGCVPRGRHLIAALAARARARLAATAAAARLVDDGDERRRRRRTADGCDRRRRRPRRARTAARRRRRSASTRRRPGRSTFDTNCGSFTVTLDLDSAPGDGRLARLARRGGVLRRHDLPPHRPGLRDPGRRPDAERDRRARATRRSTRRRPTRPTRRAWSRWRRRRRAGRHVRQPVLRRHRRRRRPAARLRDRRHGDGRASTSSSGSAQLGDPATEQPLQPVVIDSVTASTIVSGSPRSCSPPARRPASARRSSALLLPARARAPRGEPRRRDRRGRGRARTACRVDTRCRPRRPLRRLGSAGRGRRSGAGSRRSADDVEAAIVVLADGPELAPEAVARVIESWRADGGDVVAASYGGERGHPLLVARAAWSDVPDAGLRVARAAPRPVRRPRRARRRRHAGGLPGSRGVWHRRCLTPVPLRPRAPTAPPGSVAPRGPDRAGLVSRHGEPSRGPERRHAQRPRGAGRHRLGRDRARIPRPGRRRVLDRGEVARRCRRGRRGVPRDARRDVLRRRARGGERRGARREERDGRRRHRRRVARLGAIAGWALVLTTVNLVIQALRSRAGIIGSLLLGAATVAWGLATFLVVPIVALEGSRAARGARPLGVAVSPEVGRAARRDGVDRRAVRPPRHGPRAWR